MLCKKLWHPRRIFSNRGISTYIHIIPLRTARLFLLYGEYDLGLPRQRLVWGILVRCGNNWVRKTGESPHHGRCMVHTYIRTQIYQDQLRSPFRTTPTLLYDKWPGRGGIRHGDCAWRILPNNYWLSWLMDAWMQWMLGCMVLYSSPIAHTGNSIWFGVHVGLYDTLYRATDIVYDTLYILRSDLEVYRLIQYCTYLTTLFMTLLRYNFRTRLIQFLASLPSGIVVVDVCVGSTCSIA
jgi:hypothetical protein